MVLAQILLCPITREHDAVSNFSVSTFADATNVGVYDEGTDQVSGYLSGLRPFFGWIGLA